jgi:hypothetical protein
VSESSRPVEHDGLSVPDGPLDDSSILAAQREARAAIAAGSLPCYRVRPDRGDDGGYRVSIVQLPGLTLTTTGRKGIKAVARVWVALLLELDEDTFDVVIVRSPRGPRTAAVVETGQSQ